MASHPGWAGNIHEAWRQSKEDYDTQTLRESVSTLTESKEKEESGSDSDGLRDRFVSCRESIDSDASSSGRDSPAFEGFAERLHVENIVDKILYFADVSCEVAFIMPALLPHYQRLRRMIARAESFEEETDGVVSLRRRRTRSGSTGSLDTIGSSSESQVDLKAKLARQSSEGTAMHEVEKS